MAYQRLQVNNAIKVIPSDTVGIPDPASFVLQQSSVDMSVAGVATGTGFEDAGILQGAILYAGTSSKAYTVVSVDSDTQLTVTPSSAGLVAEGITIYNSATLGASLYVGGIGNVSVEMASQKNAGAISGVNPTIFSNVSQGSFMPILVTRVNETSTTATLIKALF
tara:strand:- start:33 stop:527 length:495 start_codon:yes stop_codon:yes gene_type:complete